MKKQITYETLVSLAEDAIALKGEDFCYQKPEGALDCKYVYGNTPSCIVGHMLHALGHPLTQLSQFEGKSAEEIFHCLEYVLDRQQMDFVYRLQGQQDSGIPWGRSLELAKE